MVQATGRAMLFPAWAEMREPHAHEQRRLGRAGECLALPFGVVKYGAGYWVFNELGELVGQIASIEHRPLFGCNQPTVYLRR